MSAVTQAGHLVPVRSPLTPGARIRAILDQPPHALMRLAEEVALAEYLTADSIHAQPCQTAQHAFATDNEARMAAMAAARRRIEQQPASLQATRQIVRPEDITAEITELAAGETASRPDLGG